MSNKTPQTTDAARRAPDCVTEVRVGSTTLTVSGYFKQDATETASDKMVKVIISQGMEGLFDCRGSTSLYSRNKSV